MKVMSIDPGVSGAIAVVEGFRVLHLGEMPIVKSGPAGRSILSAQDFSALLAEQKPDIVICERVGARPTDGASSAFCFGYSYGSVCALVLAAKIPLELVPPGTWKKHFGLIKAPKEASIDRARSIFPTATLNLKKHHGRADALLIGRWWSEQKGGSNASV